jgi:NAD(P)-dependent dehydrogenase (short-subunit alcohol dehydrogenase family)
MGTLTGRTALVAGATRGAGRTIAVELARAGAHVYATGRSSSATGRSEMDRPETIEETGALIAEVGTGAAVVVDHTDAGAVTRLVERVSAERGRLDILVNDMFGGDRYAEFDKPLWEHDLAGGWRMMEMGVRSHLVTAALAIPAMLERGDQDPRGLIIEMTDGTHDANVAYRRGVGLITTSSRPTSSGS